MILLGTASLRIRMLPLLIHHLSIKFYEQQALLGYLVDPSQSTEEAISASDQMKRKPHGSVGAAAGHWAIGQSNRAQIADALFRHSAPEEVLIFPSTWNLFCLLRDWNVCNQPTRIPYFQEVIVMASTCNTCGYLNSELKPGGWVPEKGKKITVCVKNIKDLSRDVIKSDSASVEVPELDLELAIVTTVEGLITKISESLERVNGFPPFKTFSRLLAILLGGLQQKRMVCLDEFFNVKLKPDMLCVKKKRERRFD